MIYKSDGKNQRFFKDSAGKWHFGNGVKGVLINPGSYGIDSNGNQNYLGTDGQWRPAGKIQFINGRWMRDNSPLQMYNIIKDKYGNYWHYSNKTGTIMSVTDKAAADTMYNSRVSKSTPSASYSATINQNSPTTAKKITPVGYDLGYIKTTWNTDIARPYSKKELVKYYSDMYNPKQYSSYETKNDFINTMLEQYWKPIKYTNEYSNGSNEEQQFLPIIKVQNNGRITLATPFNSKYTNKDFYNRDDDSGKIFYYTNGPTAQTSPEQRSQIFTVNTIPDTADPTIEYVPIDKPMTKWTYNQEEE